MKPNSQKDPIRLAQIEREGQIDKAPWRKMGGTANSKHIWVAELSAIFEEPGVYYIHIKSKDKWFEYEGKRLIHVK